MRKQELTKKVIDRVASDYPKSVAAVLLRLIALTKVPDWKTSDIEGLYSTPTTNEKLGWFLNLNRHTVRRALKTLLAEGVIVASTKERHAYRVDTERVLTFGSKFRTRLANTLGEKILNAVRMKFHRHPDRTPVWESVHPCSRGKCTCEGSFCWHPTAENIEELPVAAA